MHYKTEANGTEQIVKFLLQLVKPKKENPYDF